MKNRTGELGKRLESIIHDIRAPHNFDMVAIPPTDEEYKDRILKACKDKGLKFVPDEWDLTDLMPWNRTDQLLNRAINSQIEEIDIEENID